MEGSGVLHSAAKAAEHSSSSESAEPFVDDQSTADDTEGLLARILSEIFYSPLNLLLVVIIAVLIYKIVRGRFEEPHHPQGPKEVKLPKMKKRDFTVKELREYDGTQPEGRILMAVNGSVYDVTAGKRFYGPGGPYAAFGGRDASRGLATFKVTASDNEEYDDLSDLNSVEMGCVKEWEMQLKERYDFVGKLLKPGEKPTNYSDEDDDLSPPKSNEDDKESEKVGDIGATTETAATASTTSPSSKVADETANPSTESEVRKRIATTED